MKPIPFIVRGQRVEETKAIRAKQLRREMTPAERILWQALRSNRLGGIHFRRQQVIDGFIVDFYCHAARVIVEVDGPVHEGQTAYDIERERILNERGFRIVRFANNEVLGSLPGVLRRIEVLCGGQEKNLTPRPPSLGGKGENFQEKP